MADKENIVYRIAEDHSIAVREQLERQSQAYAQAIEKCSELKLWYEYLCWMDEAFTGTEEDRNVFESVLQTCLATFENLAEYKQDRRLVKIFIKFIELQETHEQYYELLYENGTGTEVADLYICWAHIYDQRGDYEQAEKIYTLGFQSNAQPIDLLKEAHQIFRCSMSQRILKSIDEKQIAEEMARRHRKYTNIKMASHEAQSDIPLQKNVNNHMASMKQKRVPMRDNELIRTPKRRQSLLKTILKSAQKSREKMYANRVSGQLLNFNSHDGGNFNEKEYPLHRDEQIGGVAGVFSGYDKIMLFPNDRVCYSMEELMAYKWFKRRKIANEFTRKQDQVWEIGFNVPIRWPPMFCHQNDPQENVVLSALTGNDLMPRPNTAYSFNIHKLYPNDTEDVCIEELLRNKWHENGRIFTKKLTPAPLVPQAGRSSSMDPFAMKQPSPEPSAAARTLTANVVPNKPKLSEEFRLLNDTCTTQAFNFCIRTQSVSTPKSNKLPPVQSSDDSGYGIQENIVPLCEHPPSNSIESNGDLMQQNLPSSMSTNVPVKDNNLPKSFNIYVDETQKTFTERVPKAKTLLKYPVDANVNNENAVPEALLEPTMNNQQSEVLPPLTNVENKIPEQIIGDDLELSIELNPDERAMFFKSGAKLLANNKTIDILGGNFGKSSTAADDESPEHDEDYDNDDKFGRSIYVPNNEIKCSDSEAEPEWHEITQCGGNLGKNEYLRAQVNFDETVQFIDRKLLNVEDLNPFDTELQSALLENMGFLEQLNRESICQMVNLVNPLKAKKAIDIGRDRFVIQKLIGKGNFGNIFSGYCLKTNNVLAFKQERPPNIWEYYICREVQQRISNKKMLSCYMSIEYALIGNNATVFVSKFSKYGTLLNVCNKAKNATGKNLDEYLVMLFATQILSMVEYLHAARIIHGDIKPDNFLVMKRFDDQQPNNIILQLIDFGQSIDMKLFPRAQMFHTKLKTENFVCPEMLDGRPWSYQHDTFCVASTVFTMLCGKYMILIKRKRTIGYDTQTIPRYYQKHMWTTFFDRMINSRDASSLSLFNEMQRGLSDELANLAPHEMKQKMDVFNLAIEKDCNY